MLATPYRHAGATLIELAVTFTLMSILFMLAIPSFSSWIRNVQIRTAAESVQNGIQLTRAEAVRRNTSVRFNLTDATGLPAWTVGCVTASTTCPAAIQSRPGAEGGGNAQVGASSTIPATPVPTNQYAAAIAGGAGLPAGVTFNGMGRVPTANVGADITRVDVTNTQDPTARRLVIIINSGGLIRLCDPAIALATSPLGCS